MISTTLRNELEILKDIFESNDSIISINPGAIVEEINLSDILEYWILRESAELIFVRVVLRSIRRQNLYSILLGIDGQESMEVFDFILGFMKEYLLDILRILTLIDKISQIFNF